LRKLCQAYRCKRLHSPEIIFFRSIKYKRFSNEGEARGKTLLPGIFVPLCFARPTLESTQLLTMAAFENHDGATAFFYMDCWGFSSLPAASDDLKERGK
jgi:hypothetical protein